MTARADRNLLGHSGQRRSEMGYSQFDPAMQARVAWNARKMVGTKRPLTQKQIWAIRFFFSVVRDDCGTGLSSI
jgi:hypothetical protein